MALAHYNGEEGYPVDESHLTLRTWAPTLPKQVSKVGVSLEGDKLTIFINGHAYYATNEIENVFIEITNK